MTVNDAFVAQAWAESAHAGGKARRAPFPDSPKPAGRGGRKTDVHRVVMQQCSDVYT